MCVLLGRTGGTVYSAALPSFLFTPPKSYEFRHKSAEKSVQKITPRLFFDFLKLVLDKLIFFCYNVKLHYNCLYYGRIMPFFRFYLVKLH